VLGTIDDADPTPPDLPSNQVPPNPPVGRILGRKHALHLERHPDRGQRGRSEHRMARNERLWGQFRLARAMIEVVDDDGFQIVIVRHCAPIHIASRANARL
jgi:hypothetical protein